MGKIYGNVMLGCLDTLHFGFGGKLSDEDSMKFFEDLNKCEIPNYVEYYTYKPAPPHSVFYESQPLDENGIDSNYY